MGTRADALEMRRHRWGPRGRAWPVAEWGLVRRSPKDKDGAARGPSAATEAGLEPAKSKACSLAPGLGPLQLPSPHGAPLLERSPARWAGCPWVPTALGCSPSDPRFCRALGQRVAGPPLSTPAASSPRTSFSDQRGSPSSPWRSRPPSWSAHPFCPPARHVTLEGQEAG